jgi:hypothetical protein
MLEGSRQQTAYIFSSLILVAVSRLLYFFYDRGAARALFRDTFWALRLNVQILRSRERRHPCDSVT